MRFIYCPNCGTKLSPRELKNEGIIPFCPKCADFCFNKYNIAVSMIVVCDNHILLVKQYGGNDYILVAGYVNEGESLEEAVSRELLEETGLLPEKISYNSSAYYAKSDTLMCNFIVNVRKDILKTNGEIDSFNWFSLEETLVNIKKNSLAQKFLSLYLSYLGIR